MNGEEKNSGGVKMGDEKAIQRQSLTRLLSRGSSSGPGGKIFLQDPFESFRNNGSSFQSRWVKQGQKILEMAKKWRENRALSFFEILLNTLELRIRNKYTEYYIRILATIKHEITIFVQETASDEIGF